MDATGSYLLGSTAGLGEFGSLVVLGYSGGNLTQVLNINSTGLFVSITRLNSLGYSGACQPNFCTGQLFGYSFANQQLTPVPGSPYPYGATGPIPIY